MAICAAFTFCIANIGIQIIDDLQGIGRRNDAVIGYVDVRLTTGTRVWQVRCGM